MAMCRHTILGIDASSTDFQEQGDAPPFNTHDGIHLLYVFSDNCPKKPRRAENALPHSSWPLLSCTPANITRSI
jgi:hypothetical protein